MSERYTIRGKIGQGGIGAVYRAFDTSLKREVAIKRLLSQEDTPKAEQRSAELLIREAGMLSKLQHPNIVTVYDVGIDDDGGYVVMELIDGETFDETVARGALTARDFALVVDQTLEAMIAAQQIDMLHRDIKPSNVMVSWLPSGRFQVKVLDFGLAKLSQTPSLQTIDHGDAIMGSIYFMAPEQFDRQPLDGRTDLYSLGCLYYYGLAGSYPFDGNTGPEVMVAHLEHDVVPLGQLRPDLPGSLCAWVMRMISQDIDRRPASAAAALEEFKPVLADLDREASRLAAGSSEKAPPGEYAPSPNRPQLITGAVPKTGNYSAPQHTTGAQLAPRPRASRSQLLLIWGGVFGTALLTGWVIVKALSDRASDRPPKTAGNAQERAADPTPMPLAAIFKQPLITADSAWSFLDRGEAPAAWFKPEFDDSAWPRGLAPLGFGDPVATLLERGISPGQPRLTYYFRKSITIFEPLPPGADFWLEMRVQFDDGFRLFLNGDELLREAMPQGELAADTLASQVRNNQNENDWQVYDFSPAVLRSGNNLFAVEVHQSSKTSSDIRFALELEIRPRSTSNE